ncbi:quinone reductase-like isoform X2 [Dreissena polymorpha]|uniref:quinone reductase-like isoform X2 n=1 Tax=Dreissena polymorpha TaxID=45954 RepID=UPI002264FFFF|nr:quinone reductase-like isoform X2 [Dreissena polymorpha]
MYRAYKDNMASKKLKLVIFLGSTREGRLGERVAKFVQNELNKKGKYDVSLFDPVTMDLPMLAKPLHFYKDRSEAPKKLIEANETLKAADGFLLISCEYNHCIPPALANLLDHFPGSSFAWRPSGIITYSPGIYGGMRAAMQLRVMTGELGCLSVSNIFGIPEVHKAIDETGKPLNDHMTKGLENLMKQLDWTATAFKNMRDTSGVPA